jgi:hypothetical protein
MQQICSLPYFSLRMFIMSQLSFKPSPIISVNSAGDVPMPRTRTVRFSPLIRSCEAKPQTLVVIFIPQSPNGHCIHDQQIEHSFSSAKDFWQ